MNLLEKRRKELQDRLDGMKTQQERNEKGQFSTPYPLALDMMKFMRSIVGIENPSFIEPAVGTGVFYSVYREVFEGSDKHVLGIEIDPHYFNPTKEFWQDTQFELRCADFLNQCPDEQFDMLVANPPYVRHHHIDKKTKVELQNKVRVKTGIRMSGLAGLYCYFMMLSSDWLKQGAYSCWLVPSEFMDVNYGKAVKQYLLQNVQLLRIHRFDANDLQFSDALVSSCVVVFRNIKPAKDCQVEFSMGGSLDDPKMVRRLKNNQLDIDEKWSNLFEEEERREEVKATLGDFFIVKRGIATGDNKFFILDKETVEKYEIPADFLRPILPSPRYIKGDRVNSEDGIPLVEPRQFLFSCNLPERVLIERYPTVWEYVRLGVARGVEKGYICSRRRPWYSCEEREPAAIVVPYMGRSETQNRMFRFILNRSKALTTNVYLLLYPKPQYAFCMKDESVLDEVWHELNAIPKETFVRNGRSYGGGLRKMEPNELMRTPANGVAALLTQRAVNSQMSLF